MPRSSSRSTGCPSCGPSRWAGEHIEIGAALTLSEVERLLAGRVPLLDALWPQFASRLIRNGATLGGNIGTGSPIGDAPPALLALRASVVLAGPSGEREVPLDGYFTGYRRTVKEPGELIKAVRVPLPLAPLTAFHKIAKRRFDDISSVAVAFALDVGADGVVADAAIGLGGVAATPIRATATEGALARQALGRGHRPRSRRRAGGRGHPHRRPPGQRRLPGGDARTVPAEVLRRIERDRRGARMTELSTRPPTAGGRDPMPHESADLHVTGLALYTDDLVNRHTGTPARLAGPGPAHPRHGDGTAHRGRAARCPVSSGC